MYEDLMQACQFAKYASDMSVPLSEKAVPEVGSEYVEGMANGEAVNPADPAAQVYADPIKRKALAETAVAAQAAVGAAKTAALQDAYLEGVYAGAQNYMKTAALEEAYYAGMQDGIIDGSEYEKTASYDELEEAYYAGMEDGAYDYTTKIATDFAALPGTVMNAAKRGIVTPAIRAGEAVRNGVAGALQGAANVIGC